jgi:hypothetical protein
MRSPLRQKGTTQKVPIDDFPTVCGLAASISVGRRAVTEIFSLTQTSDLRLQVIWQSLLLSLAAVGSSPFVISVPTHPPCFFFFFSVVVGIGFVVFRSIRVRKMHPTMHAHHGMALIVCCRNRSLIVQSLSVTSTMFL